MKKLLVVLLALAMILGVCATAMAADTAIPDYTDVKTSTEYASDIYRLTALGVLEGNTGWGGAYRPADNLTRAEFAKIAVYMFGKQDYVSFYAAQKSAFSDVPEGHWAEGFINCANDNGLMIGIGGGKFAPNSSVSKQEVATVVLRAVGYTDALPGAWPTDYITKSQKVIAQWANESLFDYVEKIDGTAASRAEMAAIVNYALDLYRVGYVGDQTVVYGLGDADADGYAYNNLKTNERDLYNFFLGADVDVTGKVTIPVDPHPGNAKGEITITVDPKVTTKATLLWDVFHAIEVPYLFERWDGRELVSQGPAGFPLGGLPAVIRNISEGDPRYTNDLKFVEAAGWGYEDFKKGELVFKDQYIGALLPVASDYYIYDDSLDGELWNVGDRLAALTVQVNVDNAKITKLQTGLLAGCEAVFADMLSNVNYVDDEVKVSFTTNRGDLKVDNADVYSLDLPGFFGTNLNGYYDAYDYDWFKEAETGIVSDVASDMITVDNPNFGEGNGQFCILDKCSRHDKEYVFLKDGKLYEDASFMKLNDVVYFAGFLADKAGYKPGENIQLYIVYSPVAASFDELVNGKAEINISGTDYWYCDNLWAHSVSYNNGYADGFYEAMYYDDLYAKLTEEDYDGACLFVPSYAKKYVASLIFEAEPDITGYGVITDIAFKHIYPEPDDYYAISMDFFGPDGQQTGHKLLDDNVNVGCGDTATGEDILGALTNYFLTSDDEVIKERLGDVIGSDVGFILLDPADEAFEVSIDNRGFFARFTDLDGNVIDPVNPADYGAAPKSFQDMKITADTVIFQLTTKADGTFKSVKLGDNSKYIDGDFQANQIGIFAWSGKTIKVLYVVNPVFEGDDLFGLFDVSRADNGGGFAKYLAAGTKVYFTDNQGRYALADQELVYAGYKTKDDKADTIVYDPETPAQHDSVSLKPGEFVVLIDKNGFGIDPADAKAMIINYVDGAAHVTDPAPFATIATEQFTDETEYIDLTGDGGFDEGYFTGTTHSSNAKYQFIVVRDKYGKVIEVFRVFTTDPGTEPPKDTPENEDNPAADPEDPNSELIDIIEQDEAPAEDPAK